MCDHIFKQINIQKSRKYIVYCLCLELYNKQNNNTQTFNMKWVIVNKLKIHYLTVYGVRMCIYGLEFISEFIEKYRAYQYHQHIEPNSKHCTELIFFKNIF